jgi:hypothetical protein
VQTGGESGAGGEGNAEIEGGGEAAGGGSFAVHSLEYVTVVSRNASACTKEKLRTGQLHVVKLVHVLVWLEQSVPSAH